MTVELNTIHCGDCLEWLKTLPENSVDDCVTDPPYELGFMGKAWDNTGIAYNVEMWRQVLRVLKPGAHLLSFGGTRTYHRMVCAIEDAGFEIRDQVQWLYGSGFPKSFDISKAIDKCKRRDYVLVAQKLGLQIPGNSLHDWTKAEHAPSDKWWNTFKRYLSEEQWSAIEREVIGQKKVIPGVAFSTTGPKELDITAPATDAAKQWDGWGTALKPAHEPICLARKPLSEKTVAANVLKWGTGGLNIDEGRIETQEPVQCQPSSTGQPFGKRKCGFTPRAYTCKGRWPTNVLLDEEAARMLDEQSGASKSSGGGGFKSAVWTESMAANMKKHYGANVGLGDSGGASRFFYCAKASKSERGPGNDHPTVKPLDLMRDLCRLITPPGGIILEPFAGSGTTCLAALRECFQYLACEMNDEYVVIAEARISGRNGPLFAEKTDGGMS